MKMYNGSIDFENANSHALPLIRIPILPTSFSVTSGIPALHVDTAFMDLVTNHREWLRNHANHEGDSGKVILKNMYQTWTMHTMHFNIFLFTIKFIVATLTLKPPPILQG